MEKVVEQQKASLIVDISKCSESISDLQTKIAKYRKIIEEKFGEVKKLRTEVDNLGQGEQKSKEYVKQVIRKVAAMLNGHEALLQNVQQQMVSSVKTEIRKNAGSFGKFVAEVEQMENLSQILNRTDDLEKKFRASNEKTLQIFETNMKSFETGILKIMDILNPAIQKLRLNLSLKKFEDFWAIFKEINQCLDKIDEWSGQIFKLGAEKIYNVVELQNLDTFGIQKGADSLNGLTEMLNLWKEKSIESASLLTDYMLQSKELSSTMESAEEEWKKGQIQYHEKVIEIDSNIATTMTKFNTAYTSLNEVGNIILDSVNILKETAGLKINDIMRDFRAKIQKFAEIRGKTEKIQDPKKKEQYQAEITKKVTEFFGNIQTFFDDVIRQLTETYAAEIKETVRKLNTVLKDAQKEIVGIKTIIENLNMGSSKEILLELLDLSQEYVTAHHNLVESSIYPPIFNKCSSIKIQSSQSPKYRLDHNKHLSHSRKSSIINN
jgi:hypothetical protein